MVAINSIGSITLGKICEFISLPLQYHIPFKLFEIKVAIIRQLNQFSKHVDGIVHNAFQDEQQIADYIPSLLPAPHVIREIIQKLASHVSPTLLTYFMMFLSNHFSPTFEFLNHCDLQHQICPFCLGGSHQNHYLYFCLFAPLVALRIQHALPPNPQELLFHDYDSLVQCYRFFKDLYKLLQVYCNEAPDWESSDVDSSNDDDGIDRGPD